MKFIFAVENDEQLIAYQEFVAKNQARFNAFLQFLSSNYAVTDIPNTVVLTSADIATKDISSIPIPAYTNNFRTIFCPNLNSWTEIYLKQLDTIDHPFIRDYYETKLSENHLLQILGHEFVHHSGFFPDSDYDSDIWFEEGMCEYISRLYFLSRAEFEEEMKINELLVEIYSEKYGCSSLEEFGSTTYLKDYASIFNGYWQSFLAVHRIVENHQGSIIAVFRSYQEWLAEGKHISLRHWFQI